MNGLKDRRWHYESRVKNLESFALKVESGRYDDPNQVEDFFACTIVAENLDSMSKAEKLVLQTLREILLQETGLGRGTKTLNLSPYATIVKSLFNQKLDRMTSYLTRRNGRFKVYLPRELELPPSINLDHLRNAILSE